MSPGYRGLEPAREKEMSAAFPLKEVEPD